MADIISLQELADAKLDAKSLEQFINGGVDEDVLTRLSQQYPTIKKLLLEFQRYNGRAYKTYAEMDADKANLPSKSKVTVTNDETASNNGDWQWDGVAFTKSAYDPLTQAKADATAKAEAAKNDAITAAATDATTKANAAENNDAILLTAIQIIVETISNFRGDYDTDLKVINDLINSSTEQSKNLLTAVQIIAEAVSSFRDDYDIDLKLINDLINSSHEQSKNVLTAIQIIVDAVNQNILITDGYFEDSAKQARLSLIQSLVIELAKLDGLDVNDVYKKYEKIFYDTSYFNIAQNVNGKTGVTTNSSIAKRTDYIQVKRGDLVTLKVRERYATPAFSAALYDVNKVHICGFGIVCAPDVEDGIRYFKQEIADDGYLIANTLATDSSDASITIERNYIPQTENRELVVNKSDLFKIKQTPTAAVYIDDGITLGTAQYCCKGGIINFSGLPISTDQTLSHSLFNIVFYDEKKNIVGYRQPFHSSGYAIVPETAKYFSQQITTTRTGAKDQISLKYSQYEYKDELKKYLAKLRNQLGLNCPNEYYLQDFWGASDSAWIHSAIDWVNKVGGGILIISSDYVKKQFIVDSAVIHKSNVWIVLDNVEIKLKDGVHDNLFRAAGVIVDPVNPFSKCIGLEVTNNIKLIGTGYSKISGADVAYYADIPNQAGARYWIGDEYGWRGTGLIYYGTQNFEIGNLKLQNFKNWGTDFGYSSEYGYIHDIEFWQPYKNGDGVHFTNGARHMRVHNVFGYCLDDALALVNSDDSLVFSESMNPIPGGSIRKWIYPTCPFWYGWTGNTIDNIQDNYDIVATNIGITGKEQVCTILTTQFKIHDVSVSGLSSVNSSTYNNVGTTRTSSCLLSHSGFGQSSRYVAGNIKNIHINNVIDGGVRNYAAQVSVAVENFNINKLTKINDAVSSTADLSVTSNVSVTNF